MYTASVWQRDVEHRARASTFEAKIQSFIPGKLIVVSREKQLGGRPRDCSRSFHELSWPFVNSRELFLFYFFLWFLVWSMMSLRYLSWKTLVKLLWARGAHQSSHNRGLMIILGVYMSNPMATSIPVCPWDIIILQVLRIPTIVEIIMTKSRGRIFFYRKEAFSDVTVERVVAR